MQNRILDKELPHKLFHCLLKEILFDYNVCIDWLISDETCFLSVLHLYLDIVSSDFSSFLHSMDLIDKMRGDSPNGSQGSLMDYSPDFERKSQVISELMLQPNDGHGFSYAMDDNASSYQSSESDIRISKEDVIQPRSFQQNKNTNNVADFHLKSNPPAQERSLRYAQLCNAARNEHAQLKSQSIEDKEDKDYLMKSSSESRPTVKEASLTFVKRYNSQCNVHNSGLNTDNCLRNEETLIRANFLPAISNELYSLVDYSSSDSDEDSTAVASTVYDSIDYDNDTTNEMFVCSTEKVGNINVKTWSYQKMEHPFSYQDFYHEKDSKDTIVRVGDVNSTPSMNEESNQFEKFSTADDMNRKCNKTVEILMDFLIRLRLKLERIEKHKLSSKSFKGVISLLNIIENIFDSL